MRKKSSLRQIDAPIYSYWQALYLSFYSRRLYIDISKRWRGLSLLYLLLAIAVASIPLSARIIWDFNRYFHARVMEPIEALPELYLQNGEVNFDKKMPYLIKNKNGAVVSIIDTTGKVKTISDEYPELVILVTRNTLYFRAPSLQLFANTPSKPEASRVFAQPLSEGSNEVFVGKDWVAASGILRLKYMVDVFVFPAVACFVFALYLVVMLTLALIGQVFASSIFKTKLRFAETCRLFLVASTPQIVLFFLVLALGITLPGTGVIYIAILAAYFSYAIIAVRKERNTVVPR